MIKSVARDWYRAKPATWVIAEWAGDDREVSTKAWRELMRRDKAKQLDSDDLDALIEASRRELSTSWSFLPQAHYYLGRCMREGRLNDRQTKALSEQAVQIRAFVRDGTEDASAPEVCVSAFCLLSKVHFLAEVVVDEINEFPAEPAMRAHVGPPPLLAREFCGAIPAGHVGEDHVPVVVRVTVTGSNDLPPFKSVIFHQWEETLTATRASP
ncbi:MAG: hypothetical protein ACPGXK_09730 [Phycisphaerae bacterium]